MISHYAIILYGGIAYIIVDILKEIEMQSGFFRMINYLSKNGENQLTDIQNDTGIPIHQLYFSIEKAKKLKLIKSRIDNTKYPHRNLISLTEKGELIAEKIKEIVKIING